MSQSELEYDVAFSFLSGDELLATQLNDLLQDRFKTFLYSEKQKEIAGTDGEKTFNAVFSQQSRLVVVFYRKGWGETPWTRIEETAIRNRGHEHGYDFAMLIPLDEKPSSPEWFPRNRLYIGLKRWGIQGAASVIESRIQELGGEPHEETVQDCALRTERLLKFKSERDDYLNSSKASNNVRDEFKKLQNEIENLIRTIEPNVKFKFQCGSTYIIISGPGNFQLRVGFHQIDTEVRTEYSLELSYESDSYEYGNLKKIFEFDLISPGQSGWVYRDEERNFKTKDLSEFILKDYMKNLHDIHHTKPSFSWPRFVGE